MKYRSIQIQDKPIRHHHSVNGNKSQLIDHSSGLDRFRCEEPQWIQLYALSRGDYHTQWRRALFDDVEVKSLLIPRKNV